MQGIKRNGVFYLGLSIITMVMLSILLWGSEAKAATTKQVYPSKSCNVRQPSRYPKPLITIPILMYHEIGDGPNSLYVPFNNFCEQIEFLKTQGYQVITLSKAMELLKANQKIPDSKYLVITFDDGYASFYSQAWPVLQEAGMTATVFLISQAVDQQRYLNWNDIRIMRNCGIEFGSHTRTHPSLRALGTDKLTQEISGSKKEIEEKLGTAVLSFCYPSGEFNREALAAVKNAGYWGAVSTRHGLAQGGSNIYTLSRIRVSKGTRIKDLAKMLEKVQG